eukprot:COSAG02_NODE_61504_length_268_cov_0.863905_1_plen_29_part_10
MNLWHRKDKHESREIEDESATMLNEIMRP